MGANPLHLAVLYSKSPSEALHNERQHRSHGTTQGRFQPRALGWEEKENHEEIAKKLWLDKDLHHLRKRAYDRTNYEGETAIHLAIAKRRGDLVRFFLDNLTKNEKDSLLNSSAVGTFDVANFTTDNGKVMRCKFGEHPVCWAACTNQLGLVELLVHHGARLDCKTHHDDTILHMLVRWSGWLTEDDDSGAPSNTEWLLSMYDFVEGEILKQNVPEAKSWEEKERQQYLKNYVYTANKDGLTPLLLACGRDNKTETSKPRQKMFNHLLEKHVQAMWIFGPFRGISIDVEPIDPLVTAAKEEERRQHQQTEGQEASRGGGGCAAATEPAHGKEKSKRKDTVLSILVKEQNSELICNQYIQALLDTKWNKYVHEELFHRLIQTVLMLICLVEAQLIPVTENSKLLRSFNLDWDFYPFLITEMAVFLYLFSNIAYGLLFPGSDLNVLETFVFFIMYEVLNFIVRRLTDFFPLLDLARIALVSYVIAYILHHAACVVDNSWPQIRVLDWIKLYTQHLTPSISPRARGPALTCILPTWGRDAVQVRGSYGQNRLGSEQNWIMGTFFCVLGASLIVDCGVAYKAAGRAWQVRALGIK